MHIMCFYEFYTFKYSFETLLLCFQETFKLNVLVEMSFSYTLNAYKMTFLKKNHELFIHK